MKRVLFILMPMLMFSGCGKEDNEPTVEPTLSIVPVAISFTAQAAESHDVVVTTNQSSWDAVSSQTWCTVTKGNGKFTVRAIANTSTSSPAPAVITVTAGTAKPITINVTQSGVGAELTVSPHTPIAFSSTGGDSEIKTITVTTNQSSWNVVSDQTWCTVNKSNNTFTISTSAHIGAEPRKATVTISAGSAANVTIEITQAGVGAQLSVNIDTSIPFSFTSTGGTSEAKTVTTNQSSWNVVSNQTWCTVSKSGNTFTITASANTASTERTAIVTVSAGNAANIAINITQTGANQVNYLLDNASYTLAYAARITEQYKKGQRPSYIENESGKTRIYVYYNANRTLGHLWVSTNDQAVVFSYNAPMVACGTSRSDTYPASVISAANGTYDYVNDPDYLKACFGSFTGSSVFKSLSNLKLLANNDKITQEVYDKITFPDGCYKMIVFNRKNDKTYGSYVGYTTTAGEKCIYWCIDPDDVNFGKSSTISIP